MNPKLESQAAPEPPAVAVGSGVGSGFVSVADILPLFRYAVGPASGQMPAIPFYRFGPATAFFDRVQRELPWSGAILYRRRWFKGLEAIKVYIPNPAYQPVGWEASTESKSNERKS